MSTDARAQNSARLVRVHGRELVPGTEVSISGERGRFRFIGATTASTDRLVLDFIGGPAGHECWRSFYPERVKTVHRITRTRSAATRSDPRSTPRSDADAPH